MKVKRHARQCQNPAPDPIAKWPPFKPKIRHDDKSRDRESEQVREIQRRERSERRYPPRDAVICKPAQPECKREESYSETQIEIQESFQKKHVAGDQQRPKSRRVIARIHLLKKKPGRGRQCKGAEAQEYAPRRFDGNQPAEESERSVHPKVGIRAPIGAIKPAEGKCRIFQMSQNERSRQMIWIIQQRWKRRAPDGHKNRRGQNHYGDQSQNIAHGGCALYFLVLTQEGLPAGN